MPLIIAALLGISALFIVIYPLLGLERAAVEGEKAQLADLADRERAAKDALRDVEFDRQLGNLSAQDYQALRDRYEQQAIVALGTRYHREQELDALIEQQLAQLRTNRSRNEPIRSPMETAPASPSQQRVERRTQRQRRKHSHSAKSTVEAEAED